MAYSFDDDVAGAVSRGLERSKARRKSQQSDDDADDDMNGTPTASQIDDGDAGDMDEDDASAGVVGNRMRKRGSGY
jgi:hypothetical protein